MATVQVPRDSEKSDPLQVIADALRQATAEREATRVGVDSRYVQDGAFIDLQVTGAAETKQVFLCQE